MPPSVHSKPAPCGPEPEKRLAETLTRAHRLFDELAEFLETEIHALLELRVEDHDEGRIKTVKNLIQLSQQALLKVIEIETKISDSEAPKAARTLDLEAARAEINRRLARLAD
ncbi:MAG: hypothetical protein ACFBRM_05230 [Pikeienuella sp.]